MSRIAVFPGSFDPVTLGHLNIINKGLLIFDKIIVGIGNNAEKQYMFPLSDRELWIKNSFLNNDRVEVRHYSGLTVDFCKKVDSGFILRGLRNSSDFEFEKAIANMNRSLAPGLETIFVLSDQELSSISSSIIRDIIRNGGSTASFLPSSVKF